MTGAATVRGGSALDVTFSIQLPTPQAAFPLLEKLNQLEGLQGVEFRERTRDAD